MKETKRFIEKVFLLYFFATPNKRKKMNFCQLFFSSYFFSNFFLLYFLRTFYNIINKEVMVGVEKKKM